jgi:hypothetical protein
MEAVLREKKFNEKRGEIISIAKKYIDDGKINMSKFRKEQRSAYSRLNYYFKGVKGLLQEINPNLIEERNKKGSGRGCPIQAQSVRNELAFDMLLLLRKNYTLHEIGEMYGVSRAHIHQLLNAFDENTYLKDRPVKLDMLCY